MIFYFSATGNSKAVAEMLAECLKDDAVNIMGADPSMAGENEEYIGFVFPVYAWTAPEVMLNFAKKVNPGKAFTFAVATFSNVSGMALEHFSEHLPLKCGYGVKMPDNFPVYNKIVETEETARVKLAAAKLRLEQICQWILEKREGFDTIYGEDAEIHTYQMAKQFNLHQRNTAEFWVDAELCVHCGLCERICPVGAIQLKDGMPRWVKSDCYLCAGCLNRCPVEAVQMGNYSKGKFRYVFKGFDRK